MCSKKSISKTDKNVLNRVIRPVEFRKMSYFGTWWRPVAWEHNFMPKFQVFSVLVNLKKLENTRAGLGRVKKWHFIIEKPLKFDQKKYLGRDW